jgi:hypothetical protein
LNNGGEQWWVLKDDLKESVKFMEDAMKEQTVRTEIFTGPITIVKRKAMGMRLCTAKTPEKEVRAKLIQSFEKKKSLGKIQEFYNKWEGQVSHLSGLIQDAIDKRVIKLVDLKSGGRKAYMWADNQEQSGVIREVGRGVNPLEDLTKYIQNHWDMYYRDLEAAVKNYKASRGLGYAIEEVEKSYSMEDMLANMIIGDMDLATRVKVAKHHELVGYNRDTKSVHFIDTNFEFLKTGLMKPKTAKYWVNEFTAFISTEEGDKAMRSLTARLTKYQEDNFKKED